ncbi:MAG: hypothetical protein LUO89_09300, partial [Methanothrix sp.]|nr:hypothetical protein [Methanothrix sp.]
MFTPAFMRRISQVVLLTFTASTLQSAALAAGTGQGGVAKKRPAAAANAPAAKKGAAARGTARGTANAAPAKGGKGKPAIPVATPIAAPKPAAPSQAARYGRGLERLRELTAAAQARQAGGQNPAAEIRQVRAQQRELGAMEAELDVEFTATGKHLDDHKLPAVIKARHQAAVREFRKQQTALKQKLKALDDADDAAENEKGADKESAARRDTARKARAQSLGDLDGYLKANQKRETRTPADPARPAFGAEPSGKAAPGQSPAGKARAPRQSLREYRASLFKVEPVILAGPIPNGFTMPATALPATPGAADLAATEDIVLTPAIKAQAAALNNNPVQIYNWVRNNIEYIPSYGSIQGADLTLQTLRGNDMDSASLLIALLRAANIPARYVYGTIQVPASRAANWLGVANGDAALQLLSQGGVPSQAVTAGGVTTAVLLEHVWVQAWVDYTPSRGAINKNPDTWVVMDPSFKQYAETPGLNLGGAVSLNAQGVLDNARQGAACTAGYAQSLNGANIGTAYGNYKTQLTGYLAQQGANLTVGGVLGKRAILAENYSILLGTLPYTTVVEAGQYTALPDTLRWKFSYALYANAADRAQSLNVASYTASLPSLLNHRLTVAYEPATAADVATLASYLPAPHANGTPILASEFPATLPAYLINVRAILRLDGVAVAAGGSFTLGSQLAASSAMFVPAANAWDTRDNDPNAGEYQAVVLDGQGIAAPQMDALNANLAAVSGKLAAGQYAALAADDVTGLLLQQAGMGYLALSDANSAIYRRASGMAGMRMPSSVRAIARVEPQYAFGVIIAAGFPGIKLNLDRYAQADVSKQATAGGPAVPPGYTRQNMERASAYAADALQNLLTDPAHPGNGDSAVRALAAANANSQPIRLINAGNAATVIPQLTIDASAIADIQNAAAAGKQNLVQNGVLAAGGWSGSGYIMEDPATGLGDYRLTGPAHGVMYPAGGAAWPLLNGAAWPAGMTWLALGSPAQSGASVSYALANGSTFDRLASIVLSGMDGARWQYFPAQDDVINGLFLTQLNAIKPANACDAVASVIAAGLGASSGINNGAAAMAVNHPPLIQSAPVVNGAAGQAYRYALVATDPDGDKLAYSLAQGPTGMAIDPVTGVVTWAAPLQGSYNITLRVDDGRAYTGQTYILAIAQGSLQLSLALTVTPAVAAAGSPVAIGVVTMGGQGTVTRSLTVDGAAVTLDATGKATVTAGAAGAHAIAATAADAVTTLAKQDVYSVPNPAVTGAPVAAIATPVQDANITAPVDIIGTASSTGLAWYKLVLKPAGAPDTA